MRGMLSIMGVLLAIWSADLGAGQIDLTFCLDPLVLRSGFENPYECGQTQVPYSSPMELRAMLGDPDPMEFCVGAVSGTGYSACTDVCNIELQSGCYGTLSADELVLNPTDNRICGNFSVEVADIDVHAFGQSCSFTLIGTGGMVSELESTYPSPLTWQIDAGNAQLSSVDLGFSGCGSLGPSLDLIISAVYGQIESQVEELINDVFAQPGGLRICPVDSLHPDLIPAPP